MKRLRNIITTTAVCLIALICSEIQAANSATPGNAERDSIKISLLTCSPGTEVYSLYGHTAIRLTDYGRGVDVAVNYGMFSFGKPFFVLRFIFGITDYEMGIIPFEYFCREYESEGRSIYQQELNLSAKEKAALALYGHTHKGQIWPFSLLTGAIYAHDYGYGKIGQTHIYVSSGLGLWGPPLRIGSRSEIAVIELTLRN